MFTSVCTTSSYWRMLEEEGGEKREKSQTGSHKVQLEPSSICFAGFATVQKQMQLPPLRTARDIKNQADHAESPNQEETSASLGASQPSKAIHKGTKPIASPSRTEVQSWVHTRTRTGSVQTAPRTDLLHMCPLKPGRGGSAQERGQQLRVMAQPPVRGGQSLWHPEEPAPTPTWTLLL